MSVQPTSSEESYGSALPLSSDESDGHESDGHESEGHESEGHESDGHEQPPQPRRKRSVTLMTKQTKNTDWMHIQFDKSNKPTGDNYTKFVNWVGLIARSTISINEPAWDKLKKDKVKRKTIDLLWMTIKTKWHIEDDKGRSEVLKIANTAWKNFKKKLNSKFRLKGRNPCEVYPYLVEKEWEKFVKIKSTKESEAKSEQGRANAMLNTNPTRLGARGYRGMQETWSKEMTESGASSEIWKIKDKRARDFLLARRVKAADGTYILPANLWPLAEAIIEKDKQVSDGVWVPGPGEDVLTALIGPEHPGRTRGVGHNVGLKEGIPGIVGKKRKSRTLVDTDWEQKKMQFEANYVEKEKLLEDKYKEKHKLLDAYFDEKRRTILADIEEQKKLLDAKCDMVKKMACKNDGINDGSPSTETRKSTFGSMSCLEELGSVQLPAPCQLLVVDGDNKLPCAKGMVHTIGNGLCHSVPIKSGFLKVHVDQVVKDFEMYPLPVPNEELTNLGQARTNFIQWPRDAIVFTQHTKKKSTPKKQIVPVKSAIPVQVLSKRPKELQSLYKRWESLPEPRGINIHVEPGVFGSKTFDFMIFREDIHRLVNNEWLDHTIITWFQMYLHGIIRTKEKNRCGFIFPATIYAKECKSDGDSVISNMANAMSHDKKMWFFLAPYLQSGHWTLLLIVPRRRIVYVVDSLMTKEKTEDTYVIKPYVEAAITRYQEEGGPCHTDKSKPIRWELTRCNQQRAGWECGYYDLHHMFNFVMDQQLLFPHKIPWHDTTSLTERMLNEIAGTWATRFSSAYLKHLKN